MSGRADPSHFLQGEQLVLPGPASLLVQDLCYFTITVIVEQTVDLGDEVRFGLANPRDRHRPFEYEGAQGTSAMSKITDNFARLQQRRISAHNAEHAFAFASLDLGVVPD